MYCRKRAGTRGSLSCGGGRAATTMGEVVEVAQHSSPLGCGPDESRG